jgi:tetratricopeptide (TPR) repeat protein
MTDFKKTIFIVCVGFNTPRLAAGLWILFSIMILFSACSSVKGVKKTSGETIMYGMVYNDENIPVSGAEVFIDGKTISITDAQGRFILSSRQRRTFHLTLVKTGYESITAVYFFEPTEVIHIVMLNAEHLISQAEIAMDDGRYDDTVSLCKRALALNTQRIDATYLKALAYIKLREYGIVRFILAELQAQTGNREYIKKILETLPD